MRTIIGLLISLTWFSGVQSAEQFVQSEPVVIKAGGSKTLTCRGSGGFTIAGYEMAWVRQLPNGQLQWLCYITSGGSTEYNDVVKGRVTTLRDNSNNILSLRMDNVKTEDTGVYYCARTDIWSGGTTVTVTAVEILTPQVFPLIPYGQQGHATVKAGCLTLGYFPLPVTVDWSTTHGEAVSGGNNMQFPLSGNPPSYNLVSTITVSSSEWDSKSYRCNVVHYSSSIQKTIPKGCLPPPSEPAVQLLQNSCPDSTNGHIDLTCLASNLTSVEAKIQWFVDGQESSLAQDPVHMGKSRYYSLQSTISISLSEWNRGSWVNCLVTDIKTGKSAAKTTKKCTDNYNCLGIDVIMVPPTTEDLYLGNEARIACLAVNLKQSTGFTFTWTSPRDLDPMAIEREDPQYHENATYTVKSIVTVRAEAWLQYKEFTCIFNIPGLSEPIIRRISKQRETNPLAPMVAVYPPSSEELAKKELCTLTCIATGFRPKDIFMGWTNNDLEMSKDQYVTTEPKLQDQDENQRYFVSSVLRVLCSDWENGTKYGCLVGHEQTPLIFTRKPIDKYSGNPSKVFVSLSMSDTVMSCY